MKNICLMLNDMMHQMNVFCQQEITIKVYDNIKSKELTEFYFLKKNTFETQNQN